VDADGTDDILDLELPVTAQQRAIELLEKQDRDGLSEEEAHELRQMTQIN